MTIRRILLRKRRRAWFIALLGFIIFGFGTAIPEIPFRPTLVGIGFLLCLASILYSW